MWPIIAINGTMKTMVAACWRREGGADEFRACRSQGFYRGGRPRQLPSGGQGAEPVAARLEPPHSEAGGKPGSAAAGALDPARGADHGGPGLHPEGPALSG